MKLISANEVMRQLGKWDISKLYPVEDFKKLIREQKEVDGTDKLVVNIKEHCGTIPAGKKSVVIVEVDEQPTAYDIDKVVEQIKEYFKREIDPLTEERDIDDILKHNKAVCKIVRGGGTDE